MNAPPSLVASMRAFLGHGQLKAGAAGDERLRREITTLKVERDTLTKPQPFLRRKRYEVRLHREAPYDLADGMAMRCAGSRGRASMPSRIARLAPDPVATKSSAAR